MGWSFGRDGGSCSGLGVVGGDLIDLARTAFHTSSLFSLFASDDRIMSGETSALRNARKTGLAHEMSS